jgi:hypothetical protein
VPIVRSTRAWTDMGARLAGNSRRKRSHAPPPVSSETRPRATTTVKPLHSNPSRREA